MMKYVKIRIYAERKGISLQEVERCLQKGLIQGARRVDGVWYIPEDTQLPIQHRVKTFMPIWEEVKDGTTAQMVERIKDDEERGVAHSTLLYFQSEYEACAEESGRYLESESTEIRASALLVHSMASVALGDAAVANEDFQRMKKGMTEAADVQTAAMNDMLRFLIEVFFHTDGEIKMFSPETLPYLPVGTRLFAMYGAAHAQYLHGDYSRALGIAEASLLLAMDRFPIVAIYLDLIASIAAFNLQDEKQAASFFKHAWEIAERENLMQPFVEHHGLLQGQIEKHLRDQKPEAYKMLVGKVMCFSRGWMKIHNPKSQNKVTDQLQPHEFALAMMAAKGKTNQEIADYMHISINTVKLHLSTIYQKVGVTSRKALRKHLNS